MEGSMNSVSIMSRLDRWPLPRVMVLVLAGGFGGLMMDIRVEHVDAVHEHGVAWVPIVYSTFMTVACVAVCFFWNAVARRILIAFCLVACAIGGVGFYLHNHGHLIKVFTRSLAAWTDAGMSHSEGPPQLAPMAFAGLGMIGVLACLEWFNRGINADKKIDHVAQA